MDGPHDLGGKQGFGPIDVNEPEVPYHHDWEARMWGMARCTDAPGWTIDWWRHVRELIDPVDYLARPYFDSWAQTQIAAFIDSGVLTLDEIVAGKSATPAATQPEVIGADQAVKADRNAHRFDVETDQPARYKVGDAVTTQSSGYQNHTRLPAYARGKTGTVIEHHGAHIFPDESAHGRKVGQHLYTVAFDACELWAEAQSRKDRVFLDLWESYLEPA